MAFEYAERQRCIEIICEEWAKDTGTVETKDVYARLQDEGITPPSGDMEAFLILLESEGQIRAAKMLGRDEIAKHGNMVITAVSDEMCP